MSGPATAAVKDEQSVESSKRKSSSALHDILERSADSGAHDASARKIRRCASPSHFHLPAEHARAYEPPHLAALPDRIKLNEVLRAVSVAYYRPAPQLPAASMNLFAHSHAVSAAAGGAQNESSSCSSSVSSALDSNLSSAHSKLRFGFWAPPSAPHVVEASSAFNAAAATAANAALDDADRLVFVPESARMRTLDALTSTLRKPEIWDNWTLREIALFEAAMCAFGKDFHAVQQAVKTKTTNDIVDFYYMWKKSTHYMIWKSSGKPSEPPTEPAEDRAKVVASKMRGFA